MAQVETELWAAKKGRACTGGVLPSRVRVLDTYGVPDPDDADAAADTDAADAETGDDAGPGEDIVALAKT